MGFNFNLRNGTRYNEPGTSGFVLQIIENNNSPIISNDEAVTDPQYHDSRTDMPRVYGLVCQTMRVGGMGDLGFRIPEGGGFGHGRQE